MGVFKQETKEQAMKKYAIAMMLILGGLVPGLASAESPFTIVALPDTQFYSASYPTTFTAQTTWIKNNQVSQNIVFATHEGDIINTYTNASEWTNASTAMNVLDTSTVRYGTCPGNHDSNYGGSYTAYAANFGAGRYSSKPGFLATPSPNNNCLAMTFQAGSRQFLSLSLDCWKASDSITFAQNQINLHPGMATLVTLHSYYNTDGSYTGEGQQFWDSVFKQAAYQQVFMVLCGHMHGQFHDVDMDLAGKPVYEMLADYQSEGQGGDGYLRLIQFDPDNSKILVKSYSPTKGLYKTDAGNQFEYTGVDFSRVPEPATLSLLALGGLLALRRRRQ
jgi:hypothetical protein